MNKRCGLMISLALAGVILLAGAGFAQQQSGGAGAVCPVGQQLCTGGPGGVCAVNPATQGNQNCPRDNSQQRKGAKGTRGGGRMNQPNTQVNPPAASQ